MMMPKMTTIKVMDLIEEQFFSIKAGVLSLSLNKNIIKMKDCV
jgi:hypothetical protein